MTKSKTALVLGGSEAVFAEAEKALDLLTPDAVIAINHMISLWPGKITHACTLHADRLLGWQDDRKQAGFNRDYQTIYFEKPKGKRRPGQPRIDRQMDYRWPYLESGSSGLYAVKIMLDLGYDKIVLAGVPMSDSGGHVVNGSWDGHRYRAAWVGAIPRILGKVKSMSGWTAETLGAPTASWLSE